MVSSPHYPRANGEVERAAQTIKNLMKKSNDAYLGLLMNRNAKLHNGFSPAELSMGRMQKTRVPCHPDKLLPKVPDVTTVKKREKDYREKMKENYGKRHQVFAPEKLSLDDMVWIPDKKKDGSIVQNHEAPRSVIQTSDGGVLGRNRQMARKLHQQTVPSDTVKDSTASLMPADASSNLDADRPADQSLPTAAALPSIPEPQRPVEAAKPPKTQLQPALIRSSRIKKKTRRLIEEF